MKTMMIVNSLVSDGKPTSKGGLGLIDSLGNAADFHHTIEDKNPNAQYTFLNSLGNGSIKQFGINPFNFDFTLQASSSNPVVPKYSITYPTGNVRTDSFGMQFTGGIVVKKLDADKNVWNTKKILTVEVIGTNGVVAAADAVTAFKNAMLSLISNTDITKPIKSVTHNTTLSSVYTLNDTNFNIELTGDLRHFALIKTNGMSYANTGEDAVKFERELASNDGFHYSEWDVDLFAKSNFIADPTATYDIITIQTKTTHQRDLLPNAGGFVKTLHLYIPYVEGQATLTTIYNFLNGLKVDAGINSTIVS